MRNNVVNYLEKQLCGPLDGENEILKEKPHKRYLMGILFPTEAIEDDVDENTPEELDNAVALASEFKPSSMAISFALHAKSEICITFRAGIYEKQQSNWQRKQYEQSIIFSAKSDNSIKVKIFDERARVSIVKRHWKKGFIVTVALVNNIAGGEKLDPENCLFQTSIDCQSQNNGFAEYPHSERFRFDEEQQELELQYRNRINWGVGHGCACVWDTENPSSPEWIKSKTMPATEVFGFSTNIDFEKYPSIPEKILVIQYLADKSQSNEELINNLNEFVNAYNQWIKTQQDIELPERFTDVRQRIIERLINTEERMRKGIEALSRNRHALDAFRIANRVMLMQMIHSGKNYSGTQKSRNESNFIRPDYNSKEFNIYRWRPFQLAFQLLVIESLADTGQGNYPESRDVVDLLWFPTGGGKTEAYLALAAWEMIYRRLQYGSEGAGTAVIKRYTLRLLTAQQFQRAATMICALEASRRENEQLLGTIPFTLGLWIGGASAPNKLTSDNSDNPGALEQAQKVFEEIYPDNPFQLQFCPWCGTSIIPQKKSRNREDYGIKATETSFSFNCPSDQCDYHERLPVQVVDDALYQNPPSMLIGTIDKFARLTWEPRSQTFFGKNNGYRPPSLIIQDELHLISGPLGTIAGIYEAGIDSVIRYFGGRSKVIAATATIRAADLQSRRLFGREVKIFPSPGVDESDSFFSHEDQTRPGRLYLGVMPSGHTGQTALVHAAAALLQAPFELELNEKERDTWWTLPIYHNSKRELGKTMTLARDDIPSRIGVIASEQSNLRHCDIVEELSANIKGYQIPEVIQKLKKSVDDAGVVDILPCTNMISVGVDISRLGVMVINGQPKTTAEYIQASSRVGRDKDYPPAIILTLFSPTKPRDRSHYEIFNTYHQALYRHVEPTSITPWAPPSRDRALHAALVLLVRLGGYLLENEQAGDFEKMNSDFQAMYQILEDRIEDATVNMATNEIVDIKEHLKSLINAWHGYARDNDINRFHSKTLQFDPLLKQFGANKGHWKTLNSMRNVDTETLISVWGED